MIKNQRSLKDFESETKGRTYGEYIRTKEARAESDSHIRKYINHFLKQTPGAKLVKYDRGEPGTLNYGRAVMMFSNPPGEMRRKLNELKKRKDKNYIWVIKADYGKMTMAYGTVHFPIAVYLSRAAAEKKYDEEVRYFLWRGK